MTESVQQTARERFPLGTRVVSRDGTRRGVVVGFGLHPGALAVDVRVGLQPSPWVLSHMDEWVPFDPAVVEGVCRESAA